MSDGTTGRDGAEAAPSQHAPTGRAAEPDTSAAEHLTPAQASEVDDATFLRFAQRATAEAAAHVARSRKDIAASRRALAEATELGAETPVPEGQRPRVIEAAREAGAGEDGADFSATGSTA